MRKLQKTLILLGLVAAGTSALRAQGATVTVWGTYSPVGTVSTYSGGDTVPGSGTSGTSAPNAGEATGTDGPIQDGGGGCSHPIFRYDIPATYIPSGWFNSRNGAQLFFNTFVNNTSVEQNFSQEVEGSIQTTYEGSVQISVVCAKIGIEKIQKVKKVFPVRIPANSKVEVQAFANIMDCEVEEMKVCDYCYEVLDAYRKKVAGARGINEYFN